jgi:predicted NUDIX family NTP pyrophosphohydrolase
MTKLSAGLLLFKKVDAGVEVFLVHPGGPFWAKKDLGAWSLPKGEYDQGEDPFAAALREFAEETSFQLEADHFVALGELKQPSGKIITAWAVNRDLDPKLVKSNTFEIEWPPKSGTFQRFPEVDRAGWFSLAHARQKMLKGQVDFLARLADSLKLPPDVLETRVEDTADSEATAQPSLF